MEPFKREIFEQLGNLFYAIAAEQNISLLTSGELKMLLRKDWLTDKSERTDDKVSEAAHLIGLTIDTLQSQKTPALQAYSAFEKFYRKHEEQFSYALKQKIIETADGIPALFSSPGRRNVYAGSLRGLLRQSMQGTESSK